MHGTVGYWRPATLLECMHGSRKGRGTGRWAVGAPTRATRSRSSVATMETHGRFIHPKVPSSCTFHTVQRNLLSANWQVPCCYRDAPVPHVTCAAPGYSRCRRRGSTPREVMPRDGPATHKFTCGPAWPGTCGCLFAALALFSRGQRGAPSVALQANVGHTSIICLVRSRYGLRNVLRCTRAAVCRFKR